MTTKTPIKHIAFVDLMPSSDGSVPAEILIFPDTGSATRDGRGPYSYDGVALATKLNSKVAAGGPMCFDYEHQLDDGEVRTGPIPAAAWGTSFRYVAGVGIKALIDWTAAASALVADRAYRAFSPAYYSTANGDGTETLDDIVGGSLVNRPAFLTTWLAKEQIQAAAYTAQQTTELANSMFLASLIERLGLAADTTEEAAIDAVLALQAGAATVATLEPELVTAREQLQTASAFGEQLNTAKASLQTATEQLAAVTTELASLRTAETERTCVAAVDAAIVARKITPAQKASMLTMARADIAAFSTAMGLASAITGEATPAAGTQHIEDVVLTASEKEFCAEHQIAESSYIKTKKTRLETI